jgi:hypothetical protein
MHFSFSHFCAPKYDKMRFLLGLNVLVVFIKFYIKQRFSPLFTFIILSKSLTGLPSGGESSRAGHFSYSHQSKTLIKPRRPLLSIH